MYFIFNGKKLGQHSENFCDFLRLALFLFWYKIQSLDLDLILSSTYGKASMYRQLSREWNKTVLLDEVKSLVQVRQVAAPLSRLAIPIWSIRSTMVLWIVVAF